MLPVIAIAIVVQRLLFVFESGNHFVSSIKISIDWPGHTAYSSFSMVRFCIACFKGMMMLSACWVKAVCVVGSVSNVL